MFDEEMPEITPVLQETLQRIDKMDKKELRELAKSLLLNLDDLLHKHDELQKKCHQQSQDYLSRCRSSGGVTLPPNF